MPPSEAAKNKTATPNENNKHNQPADANDAAQFAELKTQGELTRRAWEKNVQVCARTCVVGGGGGVGCAFCCICVRVCVL